MQPKAIEKLLRGLRSAGSMYEQTKVVSINNTVLFNTRSTAIFIKLTQVFFNHGFDHAFKLLHTSLQLLLCSPGRHCAALTRESNVRSKVSGRVRTLGSALVGVCVPVSRFEVKMPVSPLVKVTSLLSCEILSFTCIPFNET